MIYNAENDLKIEFRLLLVSSKTIEPLLAKFEILFDESSIVVTKEPEYLIEEDLCSRAWRYYLKGTLKNTEKCKEKVKYLTDTYKIDCFFQSGSIEKAKLAVFDMDSTLISQEVIDEIAKEAGIYSQVSAITEQAMSGEIDFKTSFFKRLELIKGVEKKSLEVIIQRLTFNPGAKQLIEKLKANHCQTALISGGFTCFATVVQAQLNIDRIYANTLELNNNQLTGKVISRLVDAKEKAKILTKLMLEYNLESQQVVAVGDGANDLPMLDLAGIGIAYHAKPLVQNKAKYAINYNGLDAAFYLLGIK